MRQKDKSVSNILHCDGRGRNAVRLEELLVQNSDGAKRAQQVHDGAGTGCSGGTKTMCNNLCEQA